MCGCDGFLFWPASDHIKNVYIVSYCPSLLGDVLTTFKIMIFGLAGIWRLPGLDGLLHVLFRLVCASLF